MANKINPKKSRPSDTEAKMPSGTQEIILGGFGTLLYGDGSINATQLLQKSNESLFGKKNSLFGKVNDILTFVTSVIPETGGRKGVTISGIKPEVFEKFNESLIKSFNDKYKLDKYQEFWKQNLEILVQKLKNELDSKKIKVDSNGKSSKVHTSGEIKIAINGASDLNNLIETLKKNSLKDDDNIIDNVEFLATKLTELSNRLKDVNLNTDIFEDLSKIGKSLSDLNKGFEDISVSQRIVKQLIDFFGTQFDGKGSSMTVKKDPESLHYLFTLISALDKESTRLSFDNVKSAMEVVTNSAKLFDKNLTVDSKLNKKLNRLIELFDSSGPIKSLVDNLKNISDLVETEQTGDAIEVLDNFFGMVSTLGDIKLRYLFRSKASIKFIKLFLLNDVKDLISKVKEFENLDNDMRKSFIALNSFFESIKVLGEIGPIKKIRMKLNLLFINRYLANDFKKIFNTLKDLAENNEENMKTVASIKDVIDSIFKLGELDKNKKKDIKKGSKFIRKFIKNDLGKIFKAIRNNLRTEAEDKGAAIRRIEYSKEILDDLNDILENSLPTTGTAFKSLIKTAFLIAEVNEIDTLLSDIKKWKSLTSKQEQLIKKDINSYVLAIIDIMNIISKHDNKTLNSLFHLNVEVIELRNLLIKLATLDKIYKEALTFTEIKTTLNNLNEVLALLKENGEIDKGFGNLFEIDKTALSKIDTMILIIERLNKLSKMSVVSKISNVGLSAIEVSADKIIVIINKLSNIEEGDIDKAKEAVKSFSILVGMSAAVLIFGAMAMAIIDIGDLALFVISLSTFLYALTGVFRLIGDSLKDSMDGAKDAVILIASAGMIMILGGLFMNLIRVDNLFAFTFCLSTFLIAIGMIFTQWSESFKDSMDGAKDAMLIVIAAGSILILGGLFMNFINVISLGLFTITLAAFLTAIGWIFEKFNEGYKESMKGAKDAMIIVGASGAILILGGLFMNFISPENLLRFTLTLAGFLLGIGIVFKLFHSAFKESLEGVRDAALLIAVSGGILIVGALFMKIIDPSQLILFTVTLAAFLAAIGGVFILFGLIKNKVMENARAAAILIAVSAGVLIAGGLFMKLIDTAGLVIFAATLAGFLLGVSGIFLLFGLIKKNVISNVIAATVFVTLAAAVLLIGGAILMHNPDLWWNSLVFIGLVAIFALGVIGIAYLLNKHQAKIWSAVVVMIVMGALTLLMAYTMQELAIAANLIDDWWSFLGVMGAMIAVIGGLLFIAYIVGQPEVVEWVLLGEVALAAMVGIIWLIGQAVSSIAQGIDDLARVSHSDLDFGNLVKLLVGFGILIGPMMGLAAMLPIIGLGAVSMLAMKSFLYDAADVIEKFASLRIPIYEGEKIVGYNIMKPSDFDTASSNIKKIVETLFNTVKEIYRGNEDMFDFSLKSLFSGGSVFSKVARAGVSLSNMLSQMAKTIQLWANLTIPVYEGTKITGYKTITSTDFITAAVNIKEVILTLGRGIIDAYNEAPAGMFDEEQFLGITTKRSPFSSVTRALKTMGPMLSSIAKGIKDWAKLTIPIYKGKDIVGYETLTSSSFVTASKNIQKVILTLGSGIIGAYWAAENDPKTKGMFDEEQFLGLTTKRSPFSSVVRAFKAMGPMLSSIAKGIQDWVELKIPIYKDGKIIDYQTINDTKLDTAANNIEKVLVCIGNALVRTVEGHTDIFEDTFGDSSPAKRAAEAMKIMGETLVLTATAVGAYASGKFPIFDAQGNYVKDLDIDLNKKVDYIVNGQQKNGSLLDAAAANIQNVLVCIGQALVDVVNNPENAEIFEDGIFTKSKAAVAAEAIKNMADALNSTVTAIQKIAELQLDDLIAALDPNGANDNIYHKLVNLLNFTSNIALLFLTPDEAKYGKTTDYWLWGGNAMSFAEFLDDTHGDVEDADKALETFTKTLSKLLTNVGNLGITYKQNFTGINQLGNVYKGVRKAMYHIRDIVNYLSADFNKEFYESLRSSKRQINDGLEASTTIINNLLQPLESIKENFEKINTFDLSQLKTLISNFTECILTLKNMNTALSTTGNEGLQDIASQIDATKVTDDLNLYADVIERIIKIAEYAANTGEEGYNVLRDGILKLYFTTSIIEENENFKHHTDDLERYVKAINSIDLSRITRLTGLVDAMNELSSHLGNLDNLTYAISDKLSAVLLELVNQLNIAGATIENAHQLQEKRKKLIQESIDKVKNIMGQHMIVEIVQPGPEDPTGDPTIKVDGQDLKNEGTTEEDGGTIPDNLLDNGNPEAQTGEQSVKQRQGKPSVSYDLLTKTDFVQLMQQHMKGWDHK